VIASQLALTIGTLAIREASRASPGVTDDRCEWCAAASLLNLLRDAQELRWRHWSTAFVSVLARIRLP
jgi:hypothetical protein